MASIFDEATCMEAMYYPKPRYPIVERSTEVRPISMADIRAHMAKLYPIDKPIVTMPKLADMSISHVILNIGCLYIIHSGPTRYTVIYTLKGLRQIEGPKSKDGSSTYYKGFVEWCTKVGAKYEDILVAGKPKRID